MNLILEEISSLILLIMEQNEDRIRTQDLGFVRNENRGENKYEILMNLYIYFLLFFVLFLCLRYKS